jgi:hypothetical protein
MHHLLLSAAEPVKRRYFLLAARACPMIFTDFTIKANVHISGEIVPART